MEVVRCWGSAAANACALARAVRFELGEEVGGAGHALGPPCVLLLVELDACDAKTSSMG